MNGQHYRGGSGKGRGRGSWRGVGGRLSPKPTGMCGHKMEGYGSHFGL